MTGVAAITAEDAAWLMSQRPPGRACKRSPYLCEQRDRIDRIFTACGWTTNYPGRWTPPALLKGEPE